MTAARVATLADFLLARIAEDEAANDEAVRDEVARCRADGMPNMTEDKIREFWGGQAWWRRRLAEVEAKRRIVTERPGIDAPGLAINTVHREVQRQREYVFRLLALPYADHLEFRDEWRP